MSSSNIESPQSPQVTIDQALQLAIQHHQAGRLQEAEAIYRAILKAQPSHPMTNHNLGILAAQIGNADASLLHHRTAAESDPEQTLFAIRYGFALLSSGQTGKAEEIFRGGIQKSGNSAEVLTGLGVSLALQGKLFEAKEVLEQGTELYKDNIQLKSNLGECLYVLGMLPDAEKMLRQALAISPEHPDTLVNLGKVLNKQDRLEEAEFVLRQALGTQPENPEILMTLGIVLDKQDRLEDAKVVLQQALSIRPKYPEALASLGTILISQDRPEDAEAALRQALNIRPEYPDALANLGAVLIIQGRLEEAEVVLRQALSIQPQYPEVLVSLGAILGKQDRLEEAEIVLRQALGIQPEYPKALASLGAILGKQDRLEEAEPVLRRALSLQSEYPEALFSLAGNLLSQGKMEEGWGYYESRFQIREHQNPRRFSSPTWDGSPLDGKTIFIHAEHGLGDQIQMMRYIPLVKARGGKVIVEMWKELAPIFQGLPEIDKIATPGEAVPQFDTYCPIMSLPKVFGTRLDNIPAPVPIHVDPGLCKQWARRLADLPGIKVGLVWSGNPAYKNDRNRSMPLFNCAPLAGNKGVSLVSVQKGAGEMQLVDCPFPIVNPGPEICDFHDTAAILSNLDLLISVDTAVAHLGGCLGISTWVLLPYASDWRWLRKRGDSPWYPSVRLFRQQRKEDWQGVIEQVVSALSDMVAERSDIHNC